MLETPAREYVEVVLYVRIEIKNNLTSFYMQCLPEVLQCRHTEL